MVTVMLALVALLGMAALVVDLGMVIMVKAQTQAVADAAALAAASALRDGMDEAAGIQAAVDIAAANEIMCEPVLLDPAVDVEVGAWDAATEQIIPWSPAFTTAVAQVTVRYTQDSPNGPVPMYFGRALGREFTEVSRSAAATVGVGMFPRTVVDLIFLQDASGSFQEEWNDAINANYSLVNLVNGISIDNDQIGFVGFNDKLLGEWVWHWDGYDFSCEWVDMNVELTKLAVDGDLPANIEDGFADLFDHSPSGYTNPGIAINWAVDEFLTRGVAGNARVMVLLSDGMPFGSTEEKTAQYRQDALDAADRAESEGVKIHTITLTAEEHGDYGAGGADFEFNESLIRNGGYAFRTHDPAQLQAILYTVGHIEYGKAALFR